MPQYSGEDTKEDKVAANLVQVRGWGIGYQKGYLSKLLRSSGWTA